ncbi:hypothetical protein D3C84_491670 [compost metagenome]
MPRVDARGQLEVVGGAAFGEVELFDGLIVVADQGEKLRTGLVQADGVAAEAAHLGDLVPDIRVFAALLQQLVEGALGIPGKSLLHQQVDAGLVQWVIVRVVAHEPFDAALCLRQAVGGDVQFDLGQVVGDILGCRLQQGLQVLAGLRVLATLDLRQGQAVAGGLQLGGLVEHGAKTLGRQARGVFVDQLHAGAHQLIAHAVDCAAGLGLFGAVAGVGDARFGNRVSQEEFRRLAVVAVLAHQALEHARHGAGVVAGLLQIDQADAIGLLLVLPGEAPLLLDGRRLGRGDGGHADVARTRRRGNDPGEHGGHHRQLHALLGFQAAGKVAL